MNFKLGNFSNAFLDKFESIKQEITSASFMLSSISTLPFKLYVKKFFHKNYLIFFLDILFRILLYQKKLSS